MNPTKVICPCCGAEFALPDNEHFAAGIAIGKDSGLGTIQLPLDKEGKGAPEKKVSKAEARLQALRDAGVDVSGLFSLRGAANEDLLVRTHADGTSEVVADDDPIFNAILKGKTIPERRLFRRWIMAQMFRALSTREGYNGMVNNFNYGYAFQMLSEEMNAQRKMRDKDPENYKMRNRWFNTRLVVTMFEHYKKKLIWLRNHADSRYDADRDECMLNIERRYYTVDEINDILTKIDKLIQQVQYHPATVVGAIKSFINMMPAKDITPASEWKNAYKGAGAYFTLRNMILFHGCSIHTKDGQALDEKDSLKLLDKIANNHTSEGWKLLTLLLKELDLNGIDIKEKRAEWAEAAQQRRLDTIND